MVCSHTPMNHGSNGENILIESAFRHFFKVNVEDILRINRIK
jgi:hypothetical protein